VDEKHSARFVVPMLSKLVLLFREEYGASFALIWFFSKMLSCLHYLARLSHVVSRLPKKREKLPFQPVNVCGIFERKIIGVEIEVRVEYCI
jgi:hypothetical protein